jgi:hypothetical protein
MHLSIGLKGWQVEDGDDISCLEYFLHTQHLFLATASFALRDRKAWAHFAIFAFLRWLWQGPEYVM